MRYFPISIDTKDKNILVLGGGAAATAKIEALLETEFKIYCISDDFTEELLKIREENPERVMLKGRVLNEEFVFFGYDYCVIATGDVKLNQILAERAKKSQIEFYRADNIGESSFRFNQVVEQGGLSVSMLSEGINPQVMKQITTDIENVLFKYDIEKLSLLNDARHLLVLKNHPNIQEEIEKLAKSNVAVIKAYYETLKRENVDIVEEFIQDGDKVEESEVVEETAAEEAVKEVTE